METEIQAAKQSFEIQKAKIGSQTKEIAEQRLLVEKQAGEIKEQQIMINEQRRMFQEQTEQARRTMADYQSLKDEFEHLKSKDTGDNVRREGPLSEGRIMPVPDEPPNFSTFPVGESSLPKGDKPSNESQNLPPHDDPLQHDAPWKGYKPNSGPTGYPTSFGEGLFAEPRQNATSPDPGLPHANATGGSAGSGSSAEALLRDLISAIGGGSNRAPHGSKVKEAETLRFPEFPTPCGV